MIARTIIVCLVAFIAVVNSKSLSDLDIFENTEEFNLKEATQTCLDLLNYQQTINEPCEEILRVAIEDGLFKPQSHEMSDKKFIKKRFFALKVSKAKPAKIAYTNKHFKYGK